MFKQFAYTCILYVSWGETIFLNFCLFVLLVKFKLFALKLLYHKVPKFSEARKLSCNLPKIQTERPNLRDFPQKNANGIANSQDPDQTAPRTLIRLLL